MRRVARTLSILAAAVGIAVVPAVASAAPAGPAPRAACPTAAPGHARCLAEYQVRTGVHRLAPGETPDGFGATDLRDAYRLPASGGTGIIAIVDAYGYPTAEQDLATYRGQYDLPACTTDNGCLRIVNQDGDTSPLPDGDPGWAMESALDLDMASAACPSCRLLLVEGSDSSVDSLATAVDTAVRLGASVVSNSYGIDEFNGMADYADHYQHPRVPVLASSGDAGFTTASFPAVLDSTIAVGGTSLKRADNDRGWSESAWSGAGSACSAWVDKPSWQQDAHCDMRTVADVSAVADPATGVAVADTYQTGQDSAWLVVGGTSAASPFVAGVVALAGRPETVTPEKLYGQPDAFFDPVGGSNGYCGGDYLCTGTTGYDAPTGLGTPDGTAAFE